MPDYLLAQLLKLSTAEIRAQRELRGIPRFVSPERRKHVWTKAERKLLGTTTDAAVAGIIGTSEVQVEKERQRLGIARYVKPLALHVWLPEEDALLGVDSDARLAIRLGVTTRVVRLKRAKLGIPRQRGSGTVNGGHVPRTEEQIWTPEMLSKLGKVSDSIIASHLKIHSREARAKRESLGIPRLEAKHPAAREWTPEEMALLGTMTDADLAKKLGINRSCVGVKRVAQGIPRFVRAPKQHVWTKEEDALIASHTEMEVAALLSITPARVRARRNQLRLPRKPGSYKRTNAGQ